MVKYIFSILLLFASLTLSGQTTYYIDPAGHDDTGDGSVGNPWLTLRKATTTVTTGNTIHVNAGTYVETLQSPLAAGVSIIGEGITSILTAPALTGSPLILLQGAAEGENGNQSISYLYFDGSDTTSYAAISIYGRKNVSVHHCTFVDWKEWAVLFCCKLAHVNGAPTTYAEDNSFYNNIVTNCSRYTTFGKGALNISGQKDVLIEYNTISSGGRPKSATNKQTEGYLIKAYPNEGYNKGITIRYNTLTTHPNMNIFRFAIEMLNVLGGADIHHNIIRGTLDFGNPGTGVGINRTTGYTYGAMIYENNFDNYTLQDSLGHKIFGVDLEGDIDGGVYIQRNIFTNCASGIVTSQTTGKTVDSVFIENNVINGLGLLNYANYGSGIAITSSAPHDAVYSNITIINNSINAGTLGKSPQYGIYVYTGSGSSTNFIIRNNITRGFTKITDTSRGIRVYTSTIDYINIDNNIIWDTDGIANDISYEGNTLTNDTETDNLEGYDPLFISELNLRLQAGSPAINAGYDTGLTTDADGNARSDIDIGAFEYLSIPIPVTGLGWEPVLSHRDFKGKINIANTWMINGSPVTATAAELNSLSAVAADTMGLSNRIDLKADTVDQAFTGTTEMEDLTITGSIATPTSVTTSSLLTDVLQVGATGATIDGIIRVLDGFQIWDGATQLSPDIPTGGYAELGDYAVMLTDLGQLYNVLDYGAVGDSLTDDTDAIQSCIDAAEAETVHRATIYFPPGIYRISDTLEIHGAANPYYSISLRGEGYNSVIFNGGTTATMSIDSASYFRIDGLCFLGNGGSYGEGATGKEALLLRSVSYVVLENVFIMRNGGNGIDCIARCWGLKFEGCRIMRNAGDGVRAVYDANDGWGSNANTMSFTNCIISNNADDGIKWAGASGFSALGNSIEYNKGSGIQIGAVDALSNSTSVFIQGNYFEENDSSQVYMVAENSGPRYVSGVVIEANIFVDAGTNATLNALVKHVVHGGTDYYTLYNSRIGNNHYYKAGATVTKSISLYRPKPDVIVDMGSDYQDFADFEELPATSYAIVEYLGERMTKPIAANVTADGGITAAMLFPQIYFSGSGAIDITADPQIVDGFRGQRIRIWGNSDTNTLTLDDGTGLKLNGGAQCVLGIDDVIELEFTQNGDWCELYRSDN